MAGPIKSRTVGYGFALVAFDSPRWHDIEHANWIQLDTLLKTYLAVPQNKGPWANSTAYVAGDRVIDVDTGELFRCGLNHTSPATGTFAADRTANPTRWIELGELPTYRGAWATSTAYGIGDIVVVSTYAWYYCVAAHTSGTFATDLAASKWTLILDVTTAVNNATTAATNAAASATAASGSEGAAATSATNAAASAATATTQASNASTSASTATTQAGIATTKAGEANTSALAAASSASAAAGHASDADADRIAADAARVAAEAAAASITTTNFIAQTGGVTGAANVSSGTTLQRPGAPVLGMLRYNTTTSKWEWYNGTAWTDLSAGGGGFRGNNGLVGTAASGDIFRVHSKTLTTNTTIGATENAIAVGTLTVDTGVTLTIDTGGELVIT